MLYDTRPQAALPFDSGCDGCGLLNGGQQHPFMSATGDEAPDLYILGEAPGAEEDRAGRQFVGRSGQLLRSLLPNLRVRYNNTVQCRPPSNRTPTQSEIEHCKTRIARDIERSKPAVVVAVGDTALRWFTQRAGIHSVRISTLRGLYFPAKCGAHEFFVVPVYHPAFVLRKGGKVGMDLMRNEYYDALRWDLSFAGRLAGAVKAGKIAPCVESNYYSEIRVIYDVERLCRILDQYRDVETIAIDYETTGLRPYYSDSRVLSVAICFGDETIAVPVQHTRCSEIGIDSLQVIELLRNYFSNKRLIAHNAFFEQEWSWLLFGNEVFGWDWADTQANQYVLNNRAFANSLDISVFLAFGFSLKSLETVNRSSTMEDLELGKLLRYNALDAKYTYKLFHHQEQALKRRKLLSTSQFVTSLMSGVTACSSRGMLPDLHVWEALHTQYQERFIEARDALLRAASVVEYDSITGKVFQLDSNDAWFSLLRRFYPDVYQRIIQDFGGTLDAGVLEAVSDEFELAKSLSVYREYSKLVRTYTGPWKKYIADDGKIHTQYNLYRTATGRLSSENPNLQNQPKRTHSELRRMVRAPDNYRVWSFDYGQIEARIIACATRDKQFLRFVRENQDVHLYWAERIVEHYPKVLRGRPITKFRSQVKNSLVFPAFYGAGVKKISRLLGIPESVCNAIYDEFWDMFSGIRQWQQALLEHYYRRFHVETLTGLRRYGPMSYNALVNTPIQGSAGHITIYMMRYFKELALKSGNMDWIPVLNVHDDLTFYLPDNAAGEEMANEIGNRMAGVPAQQFDWIIVPIEVEASTGRNWGEMEEVGKFVCTDYKTSLA